MAQSLGSKDRFPLLGVAATFVAAVAAVLQYTVSPMVDDLQRIPGGGLPRGEWWRLVTPLLVQTLGWYQVVANLVTLAVIGVVAEMLLGRVRWVVLFAAGTVGGQTAAYLWGDGGGGDSIAICGLAGGLAVVLLTRSDGHAPGNRTAVLAVLCYIAALAGWEFGGLRLAFIACLFAATTHQVLLWIGVRRSGQFTLATTLPLALAMTRAHDLHGASLTAGMATMALLLVAARKISGRR